MTIFNPDMSVCGKSPVVHVKIVNGVPAELGAWPWQAALGYKVRKAEKSIT